MRCCGLKGLVVALMLWRGGSPSLGEGLPKSERAALVDAFHSLGGETWKNGTGEPGLLLSRFCATVREIRDFDREKYGTNRESVNLQGHLDTG
eukprot:SAG31_NODE_6420_length_2026_cov_2.119875_2_plen_93_part_00